MDLKLPEPIQLESRTSERLVLARKTADRSEFVTIDFQWRRWQFGNHPHRMLHPISRSHQGRRWRENLIEDAVQALLAIPVTENVGANAKDAVTLNPPTDPQLLSPTNEPHTKPEEPPARAYAWKLLANGQISQATFAPTPEALFQLAGFRPHRVHDPVQGFLAVQVKRQGHRWVEIEQS
jgi:hypothetical protein